MPIVGGSPSNEAVFSPRNAVVVVEAMSDVENVDETVVALGDVGDVGRDSSIVVSLVGVVFTVTEVATFDSAVIVTVVAAVDVDVDVLAVGVAVVEVIVGDFVVDVSGGGGAGAGAVVGGIDVVVVGVVRRITVSKQVDARGASETFVRNTVKAVLPPIARHDTGSSSTPSKSYQSKISAVATNGCTGVYGP
jgi:hypothetical protein